MPWKSSFNEHRKQGAAPTYLPPVDDRILNKQMVRSDLPGFLPTITNAVTPRGNTASRV